LLKRHTSNIMDMRLLQESGSLCDVSARKSRRPTQAVKTTLHIETRKEATLVLLLLLHPENPVDHKEV